MQKSPGSAAMELELSQQRARVLRMQRAASELASDNDRDFGRVNVAAGTFFHRSNFHHPLIMDGGGESLGASFPNKQDVDCHRHHDDGDDYNGDDGPAAAAAAVAALAAAAEGSPVYPHRGSGGDATVAAAPFAGAGSEEVADESTMPAARPMHPRSQLGPITTGTFLPGDSNHALAPVAIVGGGAPHHAAEQGGMFVSSSPHPQVAPRDEGGVRGGSGTAAAILVTSGAHPVSPLPTLRPSDVSAAIASPLFLPAGPTSPDSQQRHPSVTACDGRQRLEQQPSSAVTAPGAVAITTDGVVALDDQSQRSYSYSSRDHASQRDRDGRTGDGNQQQQHQQQQQPHLDHHHHSSPAAGAAPPNFSGSFFSMGSSFGVGSGGLQHLHHDLGLDPLRNSPARAAMRALARDTIERGGVMGHAVLAPRRTMTDVELRNAGAAAAAARRNRYVGAGDEDAALEREADMQQATFNSPVSYRSPAATGYGAVPENEGYKSPRPSVAALSPGSHYRPPLLLQRAPSAGAGRNHSFGGSSRGGGTLRSPLSVGSSGLRPLVVRGQQGQHEPVHAEVDRSTGGPTTAGVFEKNERAESAARASRSGFGSGGSPTRPWNFGGRTRRSESAAAAARGLHPLENDAHRRRAEALAARAFHRRAAEMAAIEARNEDAEFDERHFRVPSRFSAQGTPAGTRPQTPRGSAAASHIGGVKMTTSAPGAGRPLLSPREAPLDSVQQHQHRQRAPSAPSSPNGSFGTWRAVVAATTSQQSAARDGADSVLTRDGVGVLATAVATLADALMIVLDDSSFTASTAGGPRSPPTAPSQAQSQHHQQQQPRRLFLGANRAAMRAVCEAARSAAAAVQNAARAPSTATEEVLAACLNAAETVAVSARCLGLAAGVATGSTSASPAQPSVRTAVAAVPATPTLPPAAATAAVAGSLGPAAAATRGSSVALSVDGLPNALVPSVALYPNLGATNSDAGAARPPLPTHPHRHHRVQQHPHPAGGAAGSFFDAAASNDAGNTNITASSGSVVGGGGIGDGVMVHAQLQRLVHGQARPFRADAAIEPADSAAPLDSRDPRYECYRDESGSYPGGSGRRSAEAGGANGGGYHHPSPAPAPPPPPPPAEQPSADDVGDEFENFVVGILARASAV